MASIKDLRGMVLTEVTVNREKDEILFVNSIGDRYLMFHEQDCCESVHIDDICGDLQDLVGSTILVAEENSSDGSGTDENGWHESSTWTFYKLATAKGYVDIRWFGTSNGYYSERVSLVKNDDYYNDF